MPMTCLGLYCERRQHSSYGWCKVHYERWRQLSRGVAHYATLKLEVCARCGGPVSGQATRCEPCIEVVSAEVEHLAEIWVGITLMQMWSDALGM